MLYKKRPQKVPVYAWDKTTGDPKTGDAANITGLISQDGGAPAAIADTNPTEISGGCYVFDVTADETDGDLLVWYASSTSEDIAVEGGAAFTGGSIVSAPIASTVSAGAVITEDIVAYQHAAFGPYDFTIKDNDENPIDVSGKDLALTVFAKQPNTPAVTLWELTSTAGDITVSGVDGNLVTVSADDTNTEKAGTWLYDLWNVTDDCILATGGLTIERAAPPSA